MLDRRRSSVQRFSFKSISLDTGSLPSQTTPVSREDSPLPARRVKNRSGCDACKRRRVKCDETRPRCRRCEARDETCTGNFLCDTWQMERPWVFVASRNTPSASRAPFKIYGDLTGVLENDLLRHWFNHACLTMAILPPPQNPLSFGMAPYLRNSKALRHTIQCVSQAHLHSFSGAKLVEVLGERDRALVPLQNEIDRALQCSPSSQPAILRSILLSSLLLGITSPWLIDDEYGYEYLVGTRKIVQLLLQYRTPADDFFRYLLGLYVYWELCSSYIEPCESSSTPIDFIDMIINQYLNNYLHPVTGFATTLCPVLIEVGRYYRSLVKLSPLGSADTAYESVLESKLQDWSVGWNLFPTSAYSSSSEESLQRALRLLADSQRAMGLIMLYQAKSVAHNRNSSDYSGLREAVETVMNMLQLIPPGDPLINSAAPFIVIAGSELRDTDTEYRALVMRHAEELVKFTRVRYYLGSFQLLQAIWDLRAKGLRTTWLELMLQSGKRISLV